MWQKIIRTRSSVVGEKYINPTLARENCINLTYFEKSLQSTIAGGHTLNTILFGSTRCKPKLAGEHILLSKTNWGKECNQQLVREQTHVYKSSFKFCSTKNDAN